MLAGRVPQSDRAIITKIAAEAADLSRQNIKNWRQALEAINDPENPQWYLLQDLFDYLMPDGHLGSQMFLRKAAVLSNRFMIKDKAGKENRDRTRLMEKAWFFALMGDALDASARKYAIVQFPDAKRLMNPNPLERVYDLIPHRNFVPQKNMVLQEAAGDKGFVITDPAFKNTIMVILSQEKYGYLNDLVPDLIWKRNARQAWAEFSDKFGIPLVKATTNKTNKADLDKIELMVQQMAQAAKAVLPIGTTLEIIDSATKGDPYKVFLEQINYSDVVISERILGGTMISKDGASRSQSEVHERTLDDKVSEMDKKMLEFFINDQLLPYLISIGYGLQEGDEFAFDRTESLSLAEHWKIVSEALNHYDMDEKVIAETFNLPITGIKKRATGNTDDENFNKPLKASATFRGCNWPVYVNTGCCDIAHNVTAAGGFKRFLNDLQENILQKVFDGKAALTEWVKKSVLVGNHYSEGVLDGWGSRATDIAYNATDHRALAMMEFNLFTFSAAREKASILELNRLLIDSDGKRLREFNEFKKLAAPHLQQLNQDWLNTEYNFAVASGQMASRYHEFLSEADTVTRLVQYVTAGDERVRAKHQALDNKVFSIDDAEARLLWPPNDWGCRCEFVQYLGTPPAGLMTTGAEGQRLIDWNDKQRKHFAVNRGEIGQVFTQNQMYMSTAGLGNDIKAMTYERYGLKSWEDTRNKYKPIKLDKTITPGNVQELFKPAGKEGVMVYEDYLNRKIALKRSVFDEHTTGRYVTEQENRHRLFPKVKDVLNDPDEVYLHDYRKGTYQVRYVKFYQDEVMIVPVTLGKQNLEVTTWYTMKAKEAAQRNGLLIKQKP